MQGLVGNHLCAILTKKQESEFPTAYGDDLLSSDCQIRSQGESISRQEAQAFSFKESEQSVNCLAKIKDHCCLLNRMILMPLGR